jgi:hypothetical protein
MQFAQAYTGRRVSAAPQLQSGLLPTTLLQVARSNQFHPPALISAGLATVMVMQAMVVRWTSTLILPTVDHVPRQHHLSPMQPLLVSMEQVHWEIAI